MSEARLIWPGPTLLGEGPVWMPEEQVLYFLDIKAPCVHRHDPATGVTQTFPMPNPVGCLLPRVRGGFIGAFDNGLAFVTLDPASGESQVERIADPEAHLPGNRFNDGKVDPTGRLFAGSMDNAECEPTGSLYRVDSDLSIHRLDEGYVCTNGPSFSGDGTTLYESSSFERKVYAFDLAPDGALANKRLHLQLKEDEGYPDGMTVDADDHLWLAHYGGWRLTRFTPAGSVDRIIQMPVEHVTSCTFGGPDLDTLFITSATKDLGEHGRATQPKAGGLFALDLAGTGIRGIATPRFAG